ncbi:MAG TPA: DUF2306 domain-containing protein [Chitinophagaceae bacterium]
MKSLIKNTARDALLYFLLCLATFLMLRMIVEYYPLNDHTGFLKFKQDYISNKVWRTCFYIHVFISLFVLMAGFVQFSPSILKRQPRLHRLVGRFYAGNILFVNFPVAMVMAIYANGGLPGKTAFFILDCLWFFFTLKAVIDIQKGNILSHKKYMIRSYALTLSAISLRTWKIILTNTTHIDIPTIYIMDAWLGFVPNLLLAELLIRRKTLSWLSFKPDIVGN